MSYLTVKQLSEKWGISERRIIKLCKEGRISGAIKSGKVWNVPEDTLKPEDRRSKASKYINTSKKILIVNIDEPVCEYIIPLLEKEGYLIDGIYIDDNIKYADYLRNVKIIQFEDGLKNLDKYYEGMIYVNLESKNIDEKKKSLIFNTILKKLNSEGSIVKVTRFNEKNNEREICDKDLEEVGFRINELKVKMPKLDIYVMDYKSISNDTVALLTKFKNSNNNVISTQGAIVEFDKFGKSKLLKNGEYYKLLNFYYNNLNQNDYMWLISPMMKDEWTESPLEMNFRLINLEAVNRGANIERIFLFRKEEFEIYKNNPTLNIFMQSNMKTLYVDLDEIMEKEPELIEMVGSGIGGINKETFLCDLPCDEEYRAYISINKEEIERYFEIYKRVKKYAVEFNMNFKVEKKTVIKSLSYSELTNIYSNLKQGDVAYIFDMLPEYSYDNNDDEKRYLNSRIKAVQNGANVKLFIVGDKERLEKLSNNSLFQDTLKSNKNIIILNSEELKRICLEEFIQLGKGLYLGIRQNGDREAFRDLYTSNDNLGMYYKNDESVKYIEEKVKNILKKIDLGELENYYSLYLKTDKRR